ncbi:hypothetical protein GTW52_19960 [Streptomyces sp. SID8358]|uniref:hypothetical protein n=1 Tax=unclassified Streptomyces TaxID=2593676 RepID=UPI00081B1503|nr:MULTISPECIES: hypothetical protein [unclassified Streptomyces]MYU35355.1 hypothetical protein [Streptomyces sp. SID8358]SCD83321.1 hypothetical protein GA0115239_109413 [Streptomyces sp. BpilaLS-43]
MITQLRDHVAGVDVTCFFVLAEAGPANRASLQTHDDLSTVNTPRCWMPPRRSSFSATSLTSS